MNRARSRLLTGLLAVGVTGGAAAWNVSADVGSADPVAATAGPAAPSAVATTPADRTSAVAQSAARPIVAAAAAAAAASPEVAALQRDLERLITEPKWPHDQWSVMVVSLDRGDTLFAHGPSDVLAPASNMKVFTTAAALYYLGPDFRYNTFLMGTGPIENGVLKGDLVLYGTGDPTFSSRFGKARGALESLADTLQALGVTHIEGAVIGDGSYFEGPGFGDGWKPDYMNMSYAAKAGALQYSEGIVTLQIKPGAVGAPPIVLGLPGGDKVAVQNEATTVAKGRTSLTVMLTGYDGPIRVGGQIARGAAPVTRAVPVADPAQYTAAIFAEVLSRRGIEAAGGVRSVRTAAESPVTGRSVFAPALDTSAPVRVLAIHNSPPLIDVLSVINHKSHNLMAETALRTVGRVAAGEGSAAAGARAITHMLDASGEGISSQLTIVDGSGLSPLNRVNARSFVHMLSFMAKSPMFESFWSTLPEAGARDGLRRMYRTGAEGNLRAKTGTIDHVSALSGYVRAANGEQLAFSIISNNVPSTFRAKRIEDGIGARIAAFTRPGDGERISGVAVPATADTAGSGSGTGQAAQPEKPAAKPATPSTAAKTPKPAASQSYKTYKIRKGDTLTGIAAKTGTTVAKLQKANPGLNARRLIPGKTIRLP